MAFPFYADLPSRPHPHDEAEELGTTLLALGHLLEAVEGIIDSAIPAVVDDPRRVVHTVEDPAWLRLMDAWRELSRRAQASDR